MTRDGGEKGDCGYGSEDDRKQPPEDDEEEEDEPKSSICCLQGCLAATAVGFSFLVALPSGILLVIYSSNKHDNALLSVGVVLVLLPVVMLIAVIVLCLNQRRLAQLGKNRVGSVCRKKPDTPVKTPSKGEKAATQLATVMTTNGVTVDSCGGGAGDLGRERY